MTATTTTGLAIREGLVEYGDWLLLGTVTTTVADPRLLIDEPRLRGLHLSSTLYDDSIIRITSGTRAGERSRIDSLDPAAGLLYMNPPLTGSLTAADTYEIWLNGIDPDIVDRLRDDCLSKFCSQWRVVALSVVADGDMESSGVTHWTASGATRSKGFGSFPDTHSRRELAVVHTLAADYVESDVVNVNPGERFFLQVPVRAYVTATPANPATARIVVRDKTNSANVSLGGLKTTHIGAGPGWISMLWTIPSACYQITLRLSTDTASSTTVWGGICCHKRQKMRISLPDRITTRKRVGTFYTASQINPAQSEQADFVYKLPDFRNIERVDVGAQVEVYFTPALSEFPLYYYERGYFDRLSTDYLTVAQRIAGDAATTDAKLEYLIAAVAARVAKHYLDKSRVKADDPARVAEHTAWNDVYLRAEADLNYWEGQMGPEPKLVFEAEAPPQVPYITV